MNSDIIIIGAGPAGLSFARSLEGSGLNIVMIEKQELEQLSMPKKDGRDIALTHLSKKILTDLKVWKRFSNEELSFIKEAKVLDGNSDYALRFDANAVNESELGYMVANHVIRRALYEEVAKLPNVEIVTNVSVNDVRTNEHLAWVDLSNGTTLQSKLVIAADGRLSETRRNMGIGAQMKDFGRKVIVCQMEHEIANDYIAYECFQYNGTLAVLPISQNRSSVVITLPSHQAKDVLNIPEPHFNQEVMRKFKHRLGDMNLVGERYSYPLVAVYANQFVANRFALLGDAAVGMHPVTAHGFNLGLQGQQTLATLILEALNNNQDIACEKMLNIYQRKHRRVSKPMYIGTNVIVKLFTTNAFVPHLVRKAVLRISNNIPLLRRKITDQLTASH